MRRSVIFIFLLSSFIWAYEVQDLYRFYQEGKYKKACNVGLKIFNKYRKNPDFLMLYGFSCLKADYIDRVAVPMIGLNKSKTARANASYFATVFLQKKLLYHSLLDHTDISHLRLPVTGHIISKVFQLYISGNYKKKGDIYTLANPNQPDTTYRLYMTHKHGSPVMVIEEWQHGKRLQTHRF